MDKVDNKSMTDEYLERFAEEFCKHEELMKPALYTKTQSHARKQALSKLGAAVACSELKVTLRVVRAFKQQCVNKMRLLLRAHGSGDGALALAPRWLQKLDRPFGLVTAALKLENLHEGAAAPGPPAAHSQRVAQFAWELYSSVRAAVLAAPHRELCQLRDHGALAAFADEKGLPVDAVREIWRRMYDAAFAKLREAARAGDRPGAERPTWLDWRVIDLALLHARGSVLVRTSFLNPAELEALLQLYKLMSAAHGRRGERAPEQAPAASGVHTNAEDKLHLLFEDLARPAPPPGSSAGVAAADDSGSTSDSLGGEQVWESAETWAKVHADYCRGRRAVSLVVLQRRWYELQALARRGVLLAALQPAQQPHPVLLAIVKRFPRVVTSPLASWEQLVADKRIHVDDFVAPGHLETSPTDAPNPTLMSDLIADLLDWSDDEPEFVENNKPECIQIDSDTEEDNDVNNTSVPTDTPHERVNTQPDPDGESDTKTQLARENTTNNNEEVKKPGISSLKTTAVKSEPLDDRYRNETTKTTNDSGPLEQNTCVNIVDTAQLNVTDNEVKENIIERMIPKKSKARIMFEDEDDLDDLYNFDANHDYLSTYLDQNVNTNYKTKPIEIDKSVEVKHEKDSPIKDLSHYQGSNVNVKSESLEEHSKVNSSSDSSDSDAPLNSYCKNDKTISALKQKLVKNYYKKVPRDCFKDKQSAQVVKDAVSTSGENCSSEVESALNEQCSEDGSVFNYIDEKLLKLARVVLTPLDRRPEWRLARAGCIDCRQFSEERFAAPVALSPRELNAARRYRPPPRAPPRPPPREPPRAPGVARALLASFSDLPHGHKALRRRLTARLGLPRTWPSAGFWRCARNVALLGRCRAVRVVLARPARAVKRVELADLEEVRRVNRSIRTALVAPSLQTQNKTVDTTREDTSRESPREPAGGQALPSEADLRKMIRTLSLSSIYMMRASQNLNLERERDALLRQREEERVRAQRDEYRRLDSDMRHLVRSLGESECQQKPKKIVKKYGVLSEDEKPLPDAYQEWQRQKTLVHKYFNFRQPSPCETKKDTKQIRAGNKTSASKVRKTGTTGDSKKKTHRNKIELMSVSDDEETNTTGSEPIGNLRIENQSVNDAKRSHSDEEADHSNKRVKLTAQNDNDDKDKCTKVAAQYDDNKDKSAEGTAQNDNDCKDQINEDDSDDDNRMIIDEGIVDCCYDDDPITLMDPLTTEPSYQASPHNTVWPINDVPALDSNHDTTKSVIYVIKNTKKGHVSKSARVIPTATIINTNEAPGTASLALNTCAASPVNSNAPVAATSNTHKWPGVASLAQSTALTSCVNTNADATPSTSTVNSIKLPEDVSLTLNTTVTKPVNTILNSFYFIQSGTNTVKEQSAVKVYSGHSKRRVLPKSAPTPPSKIQLTDVEIVKRSRPGPLSSKTNVYSVISKATAQQGFSKDTSLSNAAEEIDLTDDTEENDTPSEMCPKLVRVVSLKQVKKEIDYNSTAEIVSPTNTDKTANETDANVRVSDDRKHTVNVTFFLKKNVAAKIANKTNVVMETICLDSEDSDEIKTNVDCTSIKEETVDVSSLIDHISIINDENESRFVDVDEPSQPSEKEAANSVQQKTTFEGQATDDIVPRGSHQTQNSKKPPLKITPDMTSKDLLKLSTEELARLVEDDCDTVEENQMLENTHVVLKRETETPTNTAALGFLPIKIKKEKLWAQEIELSKNNTDEIICTKGLMVKREPGVTAEGSASADGSADSEELFLQGIPTTLEMKSTLPDVVCDDAFPEDCAERRAFSVREFGQTRVELAEYARVLRDPDEPLLKLDLARPLWLLADKYLVLADTAERYESPSFLTAHAAGALPPYAAVRFPERARLTLELGSKKGRDVMICGCGGAPPSCMLCRSVGGSDGRAPEFEIHKPKFRKTCRACGLDPRRERARLFTIHQRFYRQIGERPLKFVSVDLKRRCAVCRDDAQLVARPDALHINSKHYEKICDEPLTYSPVLCVLQSAARCAQLAARDAELFLLNVRSARWQRVQVRPHAPVAAFNAAVRALMAKMNREETDAWFRRKRTRKLDYEHITLRAD